jgi:CMP-N-acetylneuraminic acid synthetase
VEDEPDSADVEPFYLYNASIYAARRDYFLRTRKLVSRRQVPLIMDRYHSIDIDEEADLLVAEFYFRRLAATAAG